MRATSTMSISSRPQGEAARCASSRTAIAAGLALLLAGCGGPVTNPLAKREKTTPDGLVLVEERRDGVLFVRPDHGIGPEHRYHLSQVLLTYQADSNRFSSGQETRMREYVEDGTIGAMSQRGKQMTSRAGRCVLQMGVGLIDIELVQPNGSGSSTSMLTTWGGVTLVVDLRDSVTGEPLLRYGRRVSFPGGIQWQGDRPPWTHVRRALDEALRDQVDLLTREIPESTAARPPCSRPESPRTASATPR